MSNRASGTRFEHRLAELLAEQGFWVHLFTQNAAGQPADLIAVRNGRAYLVDCKLCQGKAFELSRVEANQDLAMGRWKATGNGEGWFAVRLGERIVMIPHALVNARRAVQSRMNERELCEDGVLLEEWVGYA